MRRSRFTESEILHLLYEAGSGVPVAEICDTAGVSLRTFYRWKRSFGGLSTADVPKMKELEFENARLRGLVRQSPGAASGGAGGQKQQFQFATRNANSVAPSGLRPRSAAAR